MDEWTELAACGGVDAHTAENPDAEQLAEAKRVCGGCLVRPECIQWALREKACSVFVAGIYLPDPKYKRELKVLYSHLESSLTRELDLRGTDI
jgi:hypothetical protein